jgi:DNA-binding LacI/PurR family transcriptional regulator
MPIYTEIMDKLVTGIRDGKYRPNTVLPSEKEICKRFNVSRTSVRNALKAMQIKGYIDRRQGSGSFVKEPKKEASSDIINLGIILNQNQQHPTSAITGSPYFALSLKGIQTAASEHSANPSMFIYDDTREINDQNFPGYQIDGFLDTGATISPNLNQYFKDNDCKVCSIFNTFHEHEYIYEWPLVVNDYLAGIREAVAYYKSLGIKKFGFFALPKMGVSTFELYRKALREVDVDFDMDSVVLFPENPDKWNYTRERAEYFSHKLFANGNQPEVLFSDGYFIIEELLTLLNESSKGQKTLGSTRFCGIGDPKLEKFSFHKNTDLVIPQKEVSARTATEILIKSIKQGGMEKNLRTYIPSTFQAGKD